MTWAENGDSVSIPALVALSIFPMHTKHVPEEATVRQKFAR